MNNTAFAYEIPSGYMGEYISHIPWEKEPAFAFSNDTDGYLKAFKNIIKIIPSGELKINFDDDIWDFRPYFNRINSYNYVLHFKNAPKDVKDHLKFFVIYMISSNIKISTAEARLRDCIYVLNHIPSENYISIITVTTDQILDVISTRDFASTTMYRLAFSTYRFLTFLQVNYHLELSVNLSTLETFTKKVKKSRDLSVDENKLANIPEEYFQAEKSN